MDNAAGHGGAAGVGGGGSGGSGAGGTGGAAGGGGDDYHVAIEAERTTVCPGQCVALSAEAKNGREPYRYAWADEIGEGAGPHEVCPEATTTYSVTATDTDVEGEFGHRSEEVSASIEIRVDDDCDDPDGGVMQPQGTTALCSLRIPHSASEPSWISTYTAWDGNSSLAVDGEGNMYISGAYRGTFTIGAHTITNVGEHDAFVMKLDPSCKPLWLKSYGAPGVQIGLGSIAIGPDGELATGGQFLGSIDLGAGLLTSGLSSTAVLLKLDAEDGAVIWSQAFASFLYNTAIWDVGIDGAGDIVFSGQGATDMSIGGAALGGTNGPNVGFLAKVSGDGTHRFGFPIVNADLMSPFALHPSGVIAATGWSAGESVVINGEAISLSSMSLARYVAMLDAGGNVLWGQQLEEPAGWSADDLHGYWGAGIAIDADRNVVVEHGHYTDTADGALFELPELITKLDSTGARLWSKSFSDDTEVEVFYGEGGLTVDSHRNIIHSDETGDPASLTPEAQDAGVQPRNLLYVRKLTPDGEPVWSHVFDEASAQWVWGLATGPDDAVWVAHASETIEASEIAATLIITKLAP